MTLKIEIRIDELMTFSKLRWILKGLASSVGSFAPWIDAGKPQTMSLIDRDGNVCGKWGVE